MIQKNQILVRLLLCSLVLASIYSLSTLSAQTLQPLPEGNSGIASNYPGDDGIEVDPAVIFVDDFETATSVDSLQQKWDVLTARDDLSIEARPGQSHSGEKSLLMTHPQQTKSHSIGIAKLLPQTEDVVFLRYYLKYGPNYYVPSGSTHNGASIYANYFVNGQPTSGVPADGQNKFLVSFEQHNPSGPAPGYMNVYIYWPEQASQWGDHFFPSGKVLPFSSSRSGVSTFGDEFVSRPDFSPELDRWYCYEFMVKANTAGQRDGRIGLWVDGVLIADFPNLRLRDTNSLKIDRIGLNFFIAQNTDRTNFKWNDDVVVATSYIGPKITNVALQPAAPQNFRVVEVVE